MSTAATSASATRRALILLAALFAGLAVLFGGTSGAGAVSLTTATTTTTLGVSPVSVTAGGTVTFSSTVTASDGSIPTGTVDFTAQYTAPGSTGSTFMDLGSKTLTPGATSSSATMSTTTLQPGTYQVTAGYNPAGSIAWSASTSATSSLSVASVQLATTTLSFTQSAQTIDSSQTVTLSTTLSTAPGKPAPTGIVRFSAGPDINNLVTLGQSTIANGSASITKGGWVAGNYVLVAYYGGDSVYSAVTSGQLSLTVTLASIAVATTNTVTLSPSTIAAGALVTITSHVLKTGTPNPPPGGPIVSFVGGLLGSDPSTWVRVGTPGQTPLGSNGYASETVGGWTPGTYVIVAQYPGDLYDSSSSGQAILTVIPAAGGAPTLTYTGATTAAWHDSATLSGTLTAPGGAPIAGESTTFTLGGDSCSATTDANGNVSCQITVDSTPGPATVVGASQGDSTYPGVRTADGFTVTQRPTTTTVANVSAVVGGTATLTATLTDTATGSPIAGETVSLTSGSSTCSAVTNAAGTASCGVPANQGIGAHGITAAFGGDTGYLGSNGSGTLTITQIPTTTTYTGDTQDVAGSTATLSANVAPAPDGGTVTFTLGTQSCSAPAAGGTASCTILLSQAPGAGYTVNVSYSGDAGYLASSTSSPFTIVSPATTTKLAPVAPVLAGTSVTLSATLTTSLGPVSGKTLTLSLGGSTCTATTNAAGVATCSVTASGPLGPTAVNASFAGDTVYKPSSDSGSTLVYALAPGGGTFVVGDKSASGSVSFWGAQWWKDNVLSGGSAPSAFKGYALNLSAPVCGATWSTDPGNSSPPPAGPLPAYMAVIVTSASTKSGSQISGNVVAIVIVKTDAGYMGDPGHAGTGTVVATVCGG